MPLKVKEKHLLYQPNWRDIHFHIIQSYQDQLVVELRYRTRKKSAIVRFQGDQITQIGKDRINIIVSDPTTRQEIAYVIGYEDILTHRYTEKDKDNLNQETKKEK